MRDYWEMFNGSDIEIIIYFDIFFLFYNLMYNSIYIYIYINECMYYIIYGINSDYINL